MSPRSLAALRSLVNSSPVRDPFFFTFDNSDASLEFKLDKAAETFKQKFGVWPTLCYVNHAPISEYRGIAIRSGSINPNNFYLVAQSAGVK